MRSLNSISRLSIPKFLPSAQVSPGSYILHPTHRLYRGLRGASGFTHPKHLLTFLPNLLPPHLPHLG